LLNLQLTAVAKNDECGGLDAAKKSAISTFLAKYKRVLLKQFNKNQITNLHSIFVYYQVLNDKQ
jgi:hypothetical protein